MSLSSRLPATRIFTVISSCPCESLTLPCPVYYCVCLFPVCLPTPCRCLQLSVCSYHVLP
ncbi:hypothetical protein C8R48DRAFT_718905 [Suillus tomentosus]|nr:hypothetical protein C8R48DRAFT_718905 [Suillus tomentosus]